MSKFKSASIPRMARAEVRALAEELSRRGFVVSEQDANGHWYMQHPCSDQKIILPTTPKGNSWKPRARAQADRILGVKHQGKARSRKPAVVSGYRPSKSDGELLASSRIKSLVAEYRESVEQFQAISASPSHRNRGEALGLVRKVSGLEEELRGLFQPPPFGVWIMEISA